MTFPVRFAARRSVGFGRDFRNGSMAFPVRFAVFAVLTLILAGCGESDSAPASLHIDGPPVLVTHVAGQDFQGGKLRLKMPAGHYLLRFSAPGCRSQWQRAMLAPGQVEKLTVQPVPVSSEVLISTRPVGAAVTFQNEEIGLTPLVIRDLAPGSYTARLSRRGYAVRTVKWEVDSERPQHVMVDLEDNLGRISFTSDPPGAKVMLDGREIGVTPCEVELEEGKYTLKMEYSGYRFTEEKLVLSRGQNLRVDRKLQALPGAITVATEPAGAELFIDGVKHGVTPCRVENLSPGNYEFKLVKTDYDPVTEVVAVAAGDNGSWQRNLISVYGRAVLTIVPAGVELIVDGRSLGEIRPGDSEYGTAPVTVERLTPGEHWFSVVHPLVKPVGKRYVFTVQKGQTLHHPPMVAWMANCEIVFPDGRREIGMLIAETEDYIEFGPEPGVRYQLERNRIKAVNRIGE